MLLVNEIYPAICGESRFSGRPCTLVRLTGCHVRCSWCDSAHSFAGGESLSVDQVVDRVREGGFATVLLTGGEPLLQPDVRPLMAALLADGRRIVLETSGTRGPKNMLPLAEVPAGVHRIVDLKAPGSGLGDDTIDWEGLAVLGADDDLKIVCVDRADYEWARNLLRAGDRWPTDVRVCFSPAHGSLEAAELAGWILEDRLEADFQIQLHKAVWPDAEGGV